MKNREFTKEEAFEFLKKYDGFTDNDYKYMPVNYSGYCNMILQKNEYKSIVSDSLKSEHKREIQIIKGELRHPVHDIEPYIAIDGEKIRVAIDFGFYDGDDYSIGCNDEVYCHCIDELNRHIKTVMKHHNYKIDDESFHYISYPAVSLIFEAECD